MSKSPDTNTIEQSPALAALQDIEYQTDTPEGIIQWSFLIRHLEVLLYMIQMCLIVYCLI